MLLIFRGDKELPSPHAAEVISGRTEPIWAFADFDPAGLMMANTLPAGRLQRVVLPSAAWLEAASKTARGRQLFDAQRPAFGRSLENAANPEISVPWQLMQRLQSAVTQERMPGAPASR